MAAVAFDTLKLARTLRTDANMSSEQAEGIANALAEAMSGAELATKADIGTVRGEVAAVRSELKAEIAAVRGEVAAVRSELKAEIAAVRGEVAAVRSELKAEIKASAAETKTEILRWMFGALAAQTALIAGLFKVMH